MDIGTVLEKLLGSGVIEKGVLVWVILQFNNQSNSMSEFRNKLNEILFKSERIEDIRIEITLLKQEVNEINMLGCKQGANRCHLSHQSPEDELKSDK